MRILIACEYSGKVREAFRKLGHDAWSCDLLPIERIALENPISIISSKIRKPDPQQSTDTELDEILEKLQTSWMYVTANPSIEVNMKRLRDDSKAALLAWRDRTALQVVLDIIGEDDPNDSNGRYNLKIELRTRAMERLGGSGMSKHNWKPTTATRDTALIAKITDLFEHAGGIDNPLTAYSHTFYGKDRFDVVGKYEAKDAVIGIIEGKGVE